MNSINYGEQLRTFDYANEGSSFSFNKLLHNLLAPGIYKGGVLSINSDTTPKPSITPAVVLIQSRQTDENEPNYNKLTLRIETLETILIETCNEANSYIVMREEWNPVKESYSEFLGVSSPLTTDIILGQGVFTNGVLTSFDLEQRQDVSYYSDGIMLGPAIGINSQPLGGVETTFSSKHNVALVLQDLYKRLIDLSGTSNKAVKARHIDFKDGEVDSSLLPNGNVLTVGGVADNIPATTVISSVIQALTNYLALGTGINSDVIGSRQLNIGVNSSQLNALLVPLGSKIDVILQDLTDVNLATTDSIVAGLTQLAERLSTTSVMLHNVSEKANAAEKFIAEYDPKKTEGIPVGTVWMYDSTQRSAWKDNDPSLLPGWFACTAANHGEKGNSVPDLEDTFLMMTSPANVGKWGGQNSTVLVKANIPSHSHNVDHIHTGEAEEASTEHLHTIHHTHSVSTRVPGGVGSWTGIADSRHNSGVTSRNVNGYGGNSGGMNTNKTHKHNINLSHKGDSSIVGEGLALENRPSYYGLIPIIKVSQA